MPKMWPRQLPAEIRNNYLRSTECRVFNKLESELGAEYTVFYSRPWYGLTPLGEEIEGECDFLVAHPYHGILCIEVKGGRIRYNPESDQWTTIDRYDTTHKIKNPVAQARKSKHALPKKNGWPNWKVHVTHGVIFPDCEVPPGGLGPDAPREIFCDGNQFANGLGTWVKQRLLSGNVGTKELGIRGMQALEDLLAKPIHLSRPLIYDIEDNNAAFLTLTQNQFLILNAIDNITRAAISGGAGTGKTVLAVEEAIRCSQKGLTTLFVCFNAPLAQKIQLDLQNYPEIHVYTFHSLCGHMAKNAGLNLDTKNSAKLYDDVLPNALLDAAELLPQARYDAIIIDEGQDFRAHWWPALDALLKERQSKLRVFWDCNQAVYGSPSLPEHTATIDIRLDRNLRNSRQIFEKVNILYKGPVIFGFGPDGPPVELREVQNHEAAIETVAETIRRMLGSEKVKASQVAATSDVQTDEIRDKLSKLVPQRLFAPCNGLFQDNCITVDSIKRLKGLEFPVVIIKCTDSLSRDMAMQYIAFSRARTKLVVIGNQAQLASLSQFSLTSSKAN